MPYAMYYATAKRSAKFDSRSTLLLVTFALATVPLEHFIRLSYKPLGFGNTLSERCLALLHFQGVLLMSSVTAGFVRHHT